jgi:hypothetical protein
VKKEKAYVYRNKMKPKVGASPLLLSSLSGNKEAILSKE